MRKLTPIIIALFLLVNLVACSEDCERDHMIPITPETSKEVLTVHGGNILVNLPSAEDGSIYEYVVEIPSENTWISVNEDETVGQSLVLKVDMNTSGEDRESLVIVTEKNNGVLIATVKISQSKPALSEEAQRMHGGDVSVTLPVTENSYEYVVNIPTDASSWVKIKETTDETKVSLGENNTTGEVIVFTVEKNTTGEDRETIIEFTDKNNNALIATAKISQMGTALRSGDFVIEEVYFSGTALPETGRSDGGDQYLKIRNNTDIDLYADGLMLILASTVNTGMNISFIDGADFRKNGCAGSAFYIIPGDGDDVLVKAGESLIIANNAQNHTIANVDSWDATKADFEWFDVSSNDNFLDVDNPDVPNLDKWYASTFTIHILHNRGFSSVAIALPPTSVDAETFLAYYSITGAKYIFHSPNGSDYEMPARGYNVPMDWVIDAVNTGSKDDFFVGSWYSTLDAGYAWCGTADGDAERFNKSVIRKSDANGKLIDTNNSTNDFDSNVKASLIK